MQLVTEELPVIERVTAAQIRQVMGDDAFGKFAILEAARGAFIQAACVWEPGEASQEFVKQTGSDPFRLEYRESAKGQLFAAEGNLTLAQVTQAFVEYLDGEKEWLNRFAWAVVED